MKNSDVDILAEVFCSVLERESFMFGVPMEREDVEHSDEMLCAQISFEGENTKGAISLVLPNSMTLELAANMLGADPDEEFVQRQSSDALGELLNVLCGQFLTTVAGELAVFDLGVPVVEAIDRECWQTMLTHKYTSVLLVEDEYNVLIELAL